ncbi:MAG: hypothetical protein VYA05_06455 [Pseudomonadota bacterium]|nr:hypothetical protein [Pseudomonadota bacterium]
MLNLIRPILISLVAVATPYGISTPGNAQEIDGVTGLIMNEGWELVQTACTECHSALIITQNSGNREVWKSRITWMQETQGLQELEVTVENSILVYLADNYGQKASTRRASLTANLLPKNPYVTDSQNGQ